MLKCTTEVREKMQKNAHCGHRERVRKQFLQSQSFDGFSDHNVLEMLLFYSIPRADTNELAHRLIDTFGSINGVFDAPYSSLCTVEGVGENTATLIKMIPALSKTYLDAKVSDMWQIKDIDDAVKYIKPKFTALNKEETIIVCLNNAGKILKTVVIGKGDLSSTEIDTRKLLNEVIVSNATQVILAHNHPGGMCLPSQADLNVTHSVAKLLGKINAKLANHIIFTDDDYFSFAQHKKHAALLLMETDEGEE